MFQDQNHSEICNQAVYFDNHYVQSGRAAKQSLVIHYLIATQDIY